MAPPPRDSVTAIQFLVDSRRSFHPKCDGYPHRSARDKETPLDPGYGGGQGATEEEEEEEEEEEGGWRKCI
ncbi:hypothetical protein E2C01_070918 [Portunus trituberculatus]|uniref:Uncharacterized protein n=1 Tax=Portunus trituberculatus TaxID=210409 RepID=A0A5B7HTZ8_PORTR|nr:hypothetical protein [Portunus trituberculatus]